MGAQNADKLLDKWVRILSQTEHTQRLLFNKGWHGATRDDEMQQERERQLEAERRRAQERERERQTREAEERQRREAHEEQRRAKESGLQRRGISKRSVAGSSSVGASSSSSSSGTAGVRKTPAGSARKPPAGTSRTNLRSRPSTIPRPVPRRWLQLHIQQTLFCCYCFLLLLLLSFFISLLLFLPWQTLVLQFYPEPLISLFLTSVLVWVFDAIAHGQFNPRVHLAHLFTFFKRFRRSRALVKLLEGRKWCSCKTPRMVK